MTLSIALMPLSGDWNADGGGADKRGFGMWFRIVSSQVTAISAGLSWNSFNGHC